MRIVLDNRRLPDKIVVSEVGTHPRREHHRRWNLDRLLHRRKPVPYFILSLQRYRALVACGFCDVHDGIIRFDGPRLHRHGSAPCRFHNRHRNNRVGLLPAKQVIGLLHDFFCVLCAKRKSSEATKCRKEHPFHEWLSHRERKISMRWFLMVSIGGKSVGATA